MNGVEKVFRTVGQFKSLDDIGSTIVNFFGNDVPVTVNDIGAVEDTYLVDRSQPLENRLALMLRIDGPRVAFQSLDGGI